jgi:hypothetical protein
MVNPYNPMLKIYTQNGNQKPNADNGAICTFVFLNDTAPLREEKMKNFSLILLEPINCE